MADTPHRNGNGRDALQTAGVVIALFVSVLGRITDTAKQDLHDAELRMTGSIAAVEARALQGRNEIRDALLTRAQENRDNITALDTRVSNNITAEQDRNNRMEAKLSAVAMRVGIYNGSTHSE